MSDTEFDPREMGLPMGTVAADLPAPDSEPAGELEAPPPAPEAPAEPAAPAPVAQPAAVEDVKPPEGYVPHSALHEERQRRKEIARQLDELRQQLAAAQKPPEQPQPETAIPDPVTEPERWRMWQAAELRKRDERLDAIVRATEQRERQAAVLSTVANLEQSFAATAPDYYEATAWLRDSRKAELAAIGYDDDTAARLIADETRGLVNAALAQGRNVAEVAYTIARNRGWKRPELPAPKPEPAAAQAIEAHAKAAAATAGLPAGGGAPAPLTPATAATMTEAEWAALPDKERKRLLRGG